MKVVFSMNNDKAPRSLGLDGFSFSFSKVCWEVV